MPSSDDNSTKIIEAALSCFEKYGLAKTTMEDIAKAAGMSRKTVYRTFSTRTELLDAIIQLRIADFLDLVKAVLTTCSTLEQAVVKGSMESLRLVRSDAIFMAIMEESNDRAVERHLLDPASPINEPMLSIWTTVFARARAQGEWRKDLTNTEAVGWIRSAQAILLLRNDVNGVGEEAFLKRFVMPALLERCQG